MNVKLFQNSHQCRLFSSHYVTGPQLYIPNFTVKFANSHTTRLQSSLHTQGFWCAHFGSCKPRFMSLTKERQPHLLEFSCVHGNVIKTPYDHCAHTTQHTPHHAIILFIALTHLLPIQICVPKTICHLKSDRLGRKVSPSLVRNKAANQTEARPFPWWLKACTAQYETLYSRDAKFKAPPVEVRKSIGSLPNLNLFKFKAFHASSVSGFVGFPCLSSLLCVTLLRTLSLCSR